MDKKVTFSTFDPQQGFLEEAILISRKGGELEKVAGQKHPAIEEYIRNLRPDPKYQYVLMTPMGAYEYWGLNKNGDAFCEVSLKHDRTKDDPGKVVRWLEQKYLAPHGKRMPPGNYTNFGYLTFLEALRYMHHANKDPSRAYGDIPIAVWNPQMRRVEVISRHWRDKADEVGAGQVIADIDEGKPRQISMGTKTPFDICLSCGSISRSTHDYCDCLKYNMGRVDEKGFLNGAINPFPRFFDLSDVIVPAAGEAGVLEKVASHQHSYIDLDFAKSAEEEKIAVIKKRDVPNTNERRIDDAVDQDPDIPDETLRSGDFEKLLTTLAMLGIVLKPREFQYSALHHQGQGRMADRLRNSRRVFRCAHSMNRVPFRPASFDSSLADSLANLIPVRSGFLPHLPKRVLHISFSKKAASNAPYEETDSPLMSKLAGLYATYRNSFQDIGEPLSVVTEQHSRYYNKHYFGDLVASALTKTASFHGTLAGDSLSTKFFYAAYRDSMENTPEAWVTPVSHLSMAHPLVHQTL